MKLWISVALLLSISTQAAELVVGYYPSWIRYTTPADKIRYQDVTTIAHAFIWPRADGSLEMYGDLLYPELMTMAHAAGVKVVVSIGGWGQCDGFAPMAANTATRKLFISNLVAFLQKNAYDGADLDWEYPNGSVERNNFTLLANEIRKAFDEVNRAWTISFVVPSGSYSESSFNFTALRDLVNWIGCMTYDLHGPWTSHAGHNSPLYAPPGEPEGSIDTAVKYLMGLGISKSKLLIGVPFYGRQFNAARLYGPSTGGGEVTYASLMTMVKPDWIYQWDDLAKAPYYQDGARTILLTFDDTVSVRYKCDYVRSNKLGGLIIWALGQDNMGTMQPLSQTIGDFMRRSTSVEDWHDRAQPVRNDLLSCYPNPFNSSSRVRFFLDVEAEISLQLYDICGRHLKDIAQGHFAEGWNEIQFSGENLPTGMYWIGLTGRAQFSKCSVTIIR